MYPAPLLLLQISPKPGLLLAQRHMLSPHSLWGQAELEPRPAAISPLCCWATVCALRPQLPQPPCLPSFCSLGPSQALGLRSLNTLAPFSHPLHQEQTPTLYVEPAGYFEGEVGVDTPKGPLPCTFTSPGEAGTPPTPSLGCNSHSMAGRRERLGPRMSLPLGAYNPRGQPGTGWRDCLAAPFYKYYT